jgi:putative FmdB family regulatory protein
MPNYKYECNECHHVMIDFQSMTDDPHIECPECKQPTLRRLIGSGMAPIFKGKGFYSTDYKSASSSEPASKCDTAAAAAPECKGCPKAEPKGDGKK